MAVGSFRGAFMSSDSINTLIDTAYCWFTRERAVYNASAGKTWVGVVHKGTEDGYTQYIISIDDTTNAIVKTQVGNVYLKDDHNEPSILIKSADDKLFTAYCGHDADKLIRYRTSTNALDSTAWESESTYESVGNVSYASCIQDSGGDIYIFYREDSLRWCYIKSTNAGSSFSGRTVIYSGLAGIGGYLMYFQSPLNANILQILVSTGHPMNDSQSSAYGFYFDCSTDKLYKLNGTETTANIPLDAASDMTPIMVNTPPNIGWIEDIMVDSLGNPRYLITFYPSGKDVNYLTKDLYYAEWNGSAITTPIKVHTEIVGDMGSVQEPAYMPNSCFHRGNPDVFIASKAVDDICEIHKVTRLLSDRFLTEQITSLSQVDQWRPITVDSDKNNVFWLKKYSYRYFTQFSESLTFSTISSDLGVYVPDTSTLKTGLISLYEFDETSGTTATDAHSTNNGTVNGATVNQTGKIGKCYSFDGSNDSVDLPITSHYTNFSFSAWVYVSGGGGGGNGRIFDKRNAGGTNAMWGFVAEVSGSLYLYLGVGWSTNNGTWRLSTPISYNQFYHFCVTYNNSSTSNNPNMYINGLPVDITEDGTPAGTLVTNTSKYWIGNRGDGDRSFYGKIDQPAIWEKILTADEVYALNNIKNGISYSEW